MSEVLEGVGVDLVGDLDLVVELLGCAWDYFFDGVLTDPIILSACSLGGLEGS